MKHVVNGGPGNNTHGKLHTTELHQVGQPGDYRDDNEISYPDVTHEREAITPARRIEWLKSTTST